MTNETASNLGDKRGVAIVVRWFLGFTSLEGVSQLQNSDNKASKCAWFLLAVTGWALTCITVSMAIAAYLAFETVTTIGVDSQTNLEFPTVTLCNPNRVHCRHLYNFIRNCTQVN